MGEQARPLASASSPYSSEEVGNFSIDQSKRELRRRRAKICCTCCAATTVIVGLLILILAFTVFKVKSPKLTFNTTKIVGLDLALQPGNANSGVNMSFVSDISIKNPNAAGFRFKNATTQLYYGDVMVGEVWSPPGYVGVRKTIHMNVTIDMMVNTVTSVSRFRSDVIAGQMPMETYTDIQGRVNVLNIVKKHVDVKLNCTMIVVISTQTITEKVCKRTVHL